MTERQPTPAKKRNWLPCGCLLIMFLLCVFLPATAYIVWTLRASGAVNVQLDRIRAAGLPTDPDEMDAFYRLRPGSEDATIQYMEAQQIFSGSFFEEDCGDLPIVGDADLLVPPPGQPWDEQEAVEAFLSDYEAGLEAAHQAASLGGGARFPLDFHDGYSMLLPHAQEIRTTARMLALEAHVKAHQGDPAGAAEAILAVASASRSLENQPIIVSQLVRMAVHSMAVELLEQLLPQVDFSEQDLIRLQEAFRRDDFKAGIMHSMAGERVMGTSVFKNPVQALGNDASPASRMVRGSNEDLALYLKIQTDMYEAIAEDYPDTFAGVEAATSELKSKITTPLGRFRYVITALTLPALESCVVAAARCDGTNGCIDAAIAVERFRKQEGELPATLNELVPQFLDAVPIDPYDGQEIRYVIRDDAYLIYICGRDRTDNGGLDDAQRSDEVIRIELRRKDPQPGEPPSAALEPAATPIESPK